MISASQRAPVATTAKGAAGAGDAAVGLAIALAFVDHSVSATTLRDVSADGVIVIRVLGGSSAITAAEASAGGAPAEGSADEQNTSTAVTGSTSYAGEHSPTGTTPPPAPLPSTPAGTVSVAAALAITVLHSSADATVTGVHLTATSITLDARHNDAADSSASGQPANRGPPATAEVTIGAAVALTDAHVTISAGTGTGSTIDTDALTLAAGVDSSTAAGAPSTSHRFSATSIAGAGSGGTLGVAGSVALAIVHLATTASAGGTLHLDRDGDSKTGTLSATATSVAQTTSSATAAPGAGGSTVGVGASVAVSSVSDLTLAELADAAVLQGGALTGGSIAIAASGTDTSTSTAGASAAGSTAAVAPYAATTDTTATTTARIGAGTAIVAGAALTVSAAQTATSTATARGAAVGGSTLAAGAGLALVIADHAVVATVARSVTAASADLEATGTSVTTAASTASTAGAPETSGAAGAGGDGVHQQLTDQATQAGSLGGTPAPAVPATETSAGGIDVAAAVALVLGTVSVTAGPSGAGSLSVLGQLNVAATSTTTAISTADGSAAAGGTASIGAAVAVTDLELSTAATAGGGTDGSVAVSSRATTVLGANSTAGASGGKISVAGSVALLLADVTTTAGLSGAVILTGGTGDVAVTATGSTTSTLVAGSTAVTGTSVGVGGAAAIALISDATSAAIADSSTVTGAHDVRIIANGTGVVAATALMGSAGGTIAATPSAAVARVTQSTIARLGTGTMVTAGGALSISATQDAAVSATAGATAAAGRAGLGLALGLVLAQLQVSAELDRNVAATGDVSISASGLATLAATGTASASGAPGETSSGAGDGASGNGVDTAIDKERTHADTAAASTQPGATPSASTSKGGVSVAAAVGVIVATVQAQTTIGAAVTTIGGAAVTISSALQTDAASVASGSATGPGAVGIGAAVALAAVDTTNQALLPAAVTVTADSLTVSATTAARGGDVVSTISAAATSGAGLGTVSIAGSLGVAIVHATTAARLDGAARLTGALVITAGSSTTTTVTAFPADDGGGAAAKSVGVGASAAIAIVTDAVTSAVSNGATAQAGAVHVIAASTSSVTAEARMGASGGSVAVAPAVATTFHTATTSATIGTGASITAASLELAGAQTATTAATATAGAASGNAAAGLALGLAIGTHSVTASVGRTVTVTGAATVTATGISHVTGSGAASSSGAGAASGGSTVDGQVSGEKNHATGLAGPGAAAPDAPSASTSSGAVGAAAAVGVALSTATVTSIILSTGRIEASTIGVTASGQADATSAGSGSAAGSASVAIGAGVALTLATTRVTAEIAGSAKAGSVTIQATSPAGSQLGATATAGAAGGVSIAGAVAISIVDRQTLARLSGSAETTGAGTLTLSSASDATVGATAVPALTGAAGTGAVGIGAAFALVILNEATLAELADGSIATLTGKLTLSSSATTSASTTATMGAAGSVGIAPAVAVILSTVEARSRIGTGATLTIPDAVTVSARTEATAAATANAAASASTAAVGLALGLASGTHAARTELARSLSGSGGVAFAATTLSSVSGSGTASAAGSTKAADADTADTKTRTGVDKQVGAERDHADTVASSKSLAGSGAATTPSAESSTAPVSAAAAIGVSLSTVTAEALFTGAVSIHTTGAVGLTTAVNADAASVADGSATGSSAAIGAGVAITLSTVVNRAVVPANLTLSASGLTLRATTAPDATAGTTSTVTADATAGAAGDVSVAGSLAFALVNHTTTAELDNGVTLTGDLVLDSGADVAATANAHPAMSAGTSVGIGAALALVILNVTTRSQISGGVAVGGANNITLTATTTSAGVANAKIGASGGVAVAPAVGIVLSTVGTSATISAGSALGSGADIVLGATQTASATATGGATAASTGSAAVGLALGLVIANHSATATVSRVVNAGHDLSLSATSISAATANGSASAGGAPAAGDAGAPDTTTPDAAGDVGVDKQVGAQRGLADKVAGKNGMPASGTEKAPSASTSAGPIAVAAAVGVVISNVQARTVIDAAVPTLSAGHLVTMTTSASADAASVADGSSTSPDGSASIGAGVALTLSTLRNEAVIPSTVSITSAGVSVRAEVAPDADNASTVGARASSGAAGKVSVAGSAAIAIIDHETRADVEGTLHLNGGDLEISAASKLMASVMALPVGDGSTASGSVGVGISFGFALVNDTTIARIGDGVAILDAADVTVESTADAETEVEARMGAAGGGVTVTPAIALTLSNVSSAAQVGTGVLELEGSLRVAAELNASASSDADAEATGAKTAAVGIALGLTIANHSSIATLSRNVDAGHAITLAASAISSATASGAASASGASENNTDTDTAGDTGVDGTVGAQRDHADKVATSRGAAGSGSSTTPKAETSGGAITVAAAVGIAISTVTARTEITSQVTDLTAGTKLSLDSKLNADAASTADGSSTSPTGSAAIAAGVAISYAKHRNEAVLPATLTVHVTDLELSATVAVSGADDTATVTATSSSGAAGKVSVAGSVALVIVDQDTRAEIDGTVLGVGGSAAGDATVTAASKITTSATALPSGAGSSGSTVGIGVSFALVLLDDTVSALVADQVSITGIRDLILDASARTSATSEARMGAAATGSGGSADTGRSASGVAVVPAVAITLSNVTTIARVGTASAAPFSVGRDLVIRATQYAAAESTGGASATAGKAAVGIALGLTIAPAGATAELARNATAGRDIRLLATSVSSAKATGQASAAGAPAESSDDSTPSNGKTGVDKQVGTQRDYADTAATRNGVRGSGTSTSPKAETSAGPIAIAAAVGVVLSDVTVRAGVTAGVTLLTAGRTVEFASAANADASSAADGSATNGGTAAIGAGVAITLSNVSNTAVIPATLVVVSQNLTLSATVAVDPTKPADHTATVSAASTAGAAGGVGVAGSVAIAIVNQNATAAVYGTVALTGGDLSATAASDLKVTVTALPAADGVTGKSFGVGVAFGLALVTDDVHALLADGVSVTGARDITLSAHAVTDASVESRMGAAATGSGGSGSGSGGGGAASGSGSSGIGIAPAIAIIISNITTDAKIGTAPLDAAHAAIPLTLTRSLSLTAVQDASASTVAGATASGGQAAVGVGLGLTIVNHGAIAQLARNLVAGTSLDSNVTLSASSRSVASADGEASASGNAPKGDEDAKDSKNRSGVDKTVGTQRDYADTVSTRQGAAGSGSGTSPSAATSDGGVSIAAGIGIVISTVDAEARVTADVHTITAGGIVTFASAANTDATSAADSSATQPASSGGGGGGGGGAGSGAGGSGSGGSSVAIGAAVALTVSNVTNRAEIPVTLTVSAHSLVVSATVFVVGTDNTSMVGAASASGAAASVGIAGSVAIAIVNQTSYAGIEGTVTLTGGDATIAAASRLLSTVTALPVGKGAVSTGGKVGVGVSFALNLIDDETTAAIEQDADLTGARNLTMSADARVDASTEAKMGAAVSGGSVAAAPAIAVTSTDVATTVRIAENTTIPIPTGTGTGTGTGTPPVPANLLTITGNLSAIATQRTSAVTKATAAAEGGSSASVGVSLALTLADDAVLARTDRNVTAGGGIDLAALGSSHNESTAEASASGAKSKTDNNGETAKSSQGSIADKLTTQRGFANTTSTTNGGKGVGATSATPTASSSDGEVSVAAAIAVIVADVSAISELPDDLALTAGGAVLLRSSQNADAISTADGTAVKAAKAGIGAAVSLSLLDLVNRAGLGQNTKIDANGFTASATMTDVDGDTVDTITSASQSGAGSTDVSVAGSFALNVVTTQTQAVIPSSAIVHAGTGDVVLRAVNLRADTATAEADASLAKGGKTGIGASIAINPILNNVTRAEIENDAVITGGHDVTIEAISGDTVVTVVKAGSAGSSAAISPAVGITIVQQTTTARIGSGSQTWTVTGSITVSARHDGSSSTTGDAKAAGDGVAVGAIIVVNVVDLTTTAETLRSLNAAGSITLAAHTLTSATAIAQASASGKSTSTAGGSNSDEQAQSQVDNTPATQGTSISLPKASPQVSSGNSTAQSQGGQKSDGVGLGAAVTVNWVTIHTVARIPADLEITAGGSVGVLAENGVDATAKATGTSLKTGSTNIGAAIALNYVNVTDTGSIGDRVILHAGGTVTVTALTPSGARNDFTAWGVAAAGGTGQASVAGSVAVQVLLLDNEATIGEDTVIDTDGGLVLAASNPMGLQTVAAAGALSTGSAAVGAAIVVNVINSTTRAAIGTGAPHPVVINEKGAMSLSAVSGIEALAVDPILGVNVPDVTAVAVAGAASGGSAAIGGALIVDVVTIATHAEIADGTSINQTVGSLGTQSLSMTATDTTTFVELAGALGLTTGSVGAGFALVLDVFNKDVRSVIGKSVAAQFGGSVLVSAIAQESFTMLAAGLAAAQSAGITGSFVVLIINQADGTGTLALIDGGAATPTTVNAGGTMVIQSQDDVTHSLLFAGGVAAGGTAGIGVSSVVLVRTGKVDAGIAESDHVIAKGSSGLSITATQSENFEATAVAGAAGGTAGVAGSATVAVHTDETYAYIGAGVIVNGVNTGASSAQGVSVSASDHTISTGRSGQLALGGTAGVGAGVDVQVITKDTRAWIAPRAQIAANGNVTVDSDSTEKIVSISAGGSGGGTAAVSVNAAVSVISVTTRATIGEECATATATATACANSRSTVYAGGNARIAANDGFQLDIIAGSVAVGGTAGVGAAAAVPVITQTTVASIGDNSIVQALGGLPAGIRVSTGGYQITDIDTRFTPQTALSGNTMDLGYVHGLTDGQRVLYDAGGGAPIGGLVSGRQYIVHVVDATKVQLSEVSTPTVVIALNAGSATGQSHRIIDGQSASTPASDAPYFDPHTSISGNSITLPYTFDFHTGDKVIYSAGGGTAIGGLVDGDTYTVVVSGQVVQLKDAYGNVVTLDPSVATGRAHSLVTQGEQPSPDAASTSGVRSVTGEFLNGFVGVAVTATSTTDVAGVGASAGVSGVAGVAVGGSVNVITTVTNAFIGRIAQVSAGSPTSRGSVLVAVGTTSPC